jgi:2',3'-cyclic-nucleotide 2'-phosphodiesterase (5'-nucleotidase family)
MVSAKANLMLESLSLMGYDALGIGDDDLTLGKEFLSELSKKAPFPFLSSNLMEAESGKLLFQSTLIKEVSGLKVGIFSLLSPDVFSGSQDPRLKGLTLQNPIETAQRIARELKPNTDLIILLSHLGYPKDVEMAQTVPGIHIIVGSHTGVSLTYPPIIKDTIILHSPVKGMYFGQFELAFSNGEAGFYNSATTRSLENNLSNLRLRSNRKEAPKTEKEQYQRSIGEAERSLKQMEGKNQFSNTLFPLTDQIKEDPQVLKLLEDFKRHFQEPDKTSPPKQ